MRNRIALSLIFSLVVVSITPLIYAARDTGPTTSEGTGDGNDNTAIAADFIRQIPLITNDVVYSSSTGKLYASVPSSAGPTGNRIATINPLTGSVDNSVFIGSEPNVLAISDDGNSLYAALDGAFAVRRFDTQTDTPGQQFSVGQDLSLTRYRVNDLAVAPGDPNVLAIARHLPNTTPPEGGVAVFDNGVQRPTTGPGHTAGSSYLAYSASASKLYGGGLNGLLKTMTVNASGVTVTATASLSVGSRIKFSNGLIFSSTGDVVNPDGSGTLLGKFPAISTNAFVPDTAAGRAYYVVNETSSTATIKAFDINTFQLVGSVTVPGATGTSRSLVRWGSNGLALRTSTNQLFLIQTSLIPSGDPIPTPTATPAPTPSPSPATFDTFVKQVALPNNDLVFDQSTQKLYASVPSRAGSTGNSITMIDPATATLGNSVFVGSEPMKLALADDAQTMYVELDGAAAVRRFNTATQTAGQQFTLGRDSFSGPYRLSDMAVAPGNPGLLAVARQTRNGFPSTAGVVIFDNGVQRPNMGGSSDWLAFSNSASTLYGAGFNGLTTMNVDINGAAGDFPKNFNSGDGIKFANGLVYGASGQVINPGTGAIVGTFSGLGSGSPTLAVDVPNGRVFLIAITSSTTQLRAYDINTFALLGSINLGISAFSVSSLVRWGTNGLAFRNADKVFIIQTTLVSSSEPVPAPTPSPSPTPTPSPAYVPTFIRRVDLPVNALVYSPVTQALHASVPSSAGSNGNSITRIIPETGVVGPSVSVGSGPNRLALSDDGQTLYTTLDGTNVIRRFNVVTGTPGLQFSGLANFPSDLEVVPGSPDSVAVSRGNNGVTIFDNGVARPNSGNSSTGPIEFGASSSTLYGYNSFSTGYQLAKYSVDPSGLSTVHVTENLLTGFTDTLEFSNGRLYSGSGRVADPENRTLAGTFQGITTPNAIAIDQANSRAFYVYSNGSSLVLSAFDINTFLPLGSVLLSGIPGTPVSLVRWGTNGLAFNTVGSPGSQDPALSKVYILQSELVSNALPIPTGVQLSSDRYVTNESLPNVSITVTRTGDVSGSTSVNYATSDGTATAGSDYTSTSGTLVFSAGEISKTITVAILNDNTPELAAETFGFTLSNITGGATLTTPASAVVTINDDDNSSFQVANSSYTVVEGINSLTITVTRTGNTSSPGVVGYSTADTAGPNTCNLFNGAASSRCDYLTARGNLRFLAGQSSKTVLVPVINDSYAEGNETFTFGLNNPVNGTLGSTASATVTITDNETVNGPNPIDQADFFVRLHYIDFLNREPDAAGLAFWSNQITECQQPGATCDAEVRRINVSAAFFVSIEFQETGYLVYRMYKAGHGNIPGTPVPLTLNEFLPDTQQIGQGVVVGVGNWQQVLEANKAVFAQEFVSRPRFTSSYPSTLTPEEFVDALFANAAVTPSAGDRNAAISDFGGATTTVSLTARGRALRRVAQNAMLAQQETNRAFVLMQYFGYLRRNPNDAPEPGLNFDGYNFWLGKLNEFNGNYINAELVKAFISSSEYRQRFGQ